MCDEIESLGLSEHALMRNLPPMICDIVRATDIATGLKFASTFSGELIYLPDDPKGTRIGEVVGEENARKIIDLLGGNRNVNVPPFLGNRIMTRLKGIRMLECGASINGVSKELGVSRSTVKTWKRDFVEVVK